LGAPLNSLIVRGPFHGPTGYDRHTREFVREFHRQGIVVQLFDLPIWSPARLPVGSSDVWFDTLSTPSDARTVLHFCMPTQVRRAPNRNNVNYTMFEANRVPASWVDENRKHELLIVPTESSRQAWLASGLPKHRVQVCPLGVNPEVFNGTALPRSLTLESGEPVASYRTRMLNISEPTPRKNLSGLIAAWLLATSANEDAILILKLGCYTRHAESFLEQQIVSAEQCAGKTRRDAAPILFLNEMLADPELPGLYTAATHYVSLSFGEGWDLPMMEAAASGLRLIAPDHSAYRDYLDPSIATMLPSKETPVNYAGGDPPTAALFEGASWWKPDQDAAITAIRSAIEGGDALVESAGTRILAKYSWQKAAVRLIEILAELESLRLKLPASLVAQPK
jgi:glycosyltransferase involved in cell wall biosynthesis